jgi:outer membrane receptor protein involved in Fe transport
LRYTSPDNQQWLPAFSLGSLSAGYALVLPRSAEKRELHSIRETLTLQLGVQNIFNTDYQVIAWRPMPGRNYTVTLTWNFHDPYHLY